MRLWSTKKMQHAIIRKVRIVMCDNNNKNVGSIKEKLQNDKKLYRHCFPSVTLLLRHLSILLDGWSICCSHKVYFSFERIWWKSRSENVAIDFSTYAIFRLLPSPPQYGKNRTIALQEILIIGGKNKIDFNSR